MSDDQSHDVSLTKASLIRVCLGHGMTPAARVADMVEHFGRREVLAVARKTYGSAAREAIRLIELSDALAREEEFERLHGRPSIEERSGKVDAAALLKAADVLGTTLEGLGVR